MMLSKLCENDILITELFKLGFISGKLIYHRDIVLNFDRDLQHGYDRPEAVKRTAKAFGCSIFTVYRAINKLGK